MCRIPFLDLHAMHAEIFEELDDAWRSVSSSSHFVGGRFVSQFEDQWAEYCRSVHCVGVSDGTAALELALRALGIGPGYEVIVPANTFIATWEAVAAVGAQPAPIDVSSETLLMTPQGVEAAIGPRTAAVIAVHLYGQPVDMIGIKRVCQRAGIAVIEDAAQAHGAEWQGQRVGGLADIGCFSFYPGKNLGAFGDAGAVVTNQSGLANAIRSIANHGREAGAADRHVRVGNNRRLDGLQAAILSVKLRHLDRWNASRERVMQQYRRELSGTSARFVKTAPGAVSSHHLAVVQVPDRDRVQSALTKMGIETGIHYRTPCHLQPAFAHLSRLCLPVAETAAQRILSLPLYPHLTEIQVSRAAAALRQILEQQELTLAAAE